MAFWDFSSLFLLLLLLLIRLQLHTETKRSYILNHSFFKDFFSDFLIHDRFVWVCLRVAFATRVCGGKKHGKQNSGYTEKQTKTHTHRIDTNDWSKRTCKHKFIYYYFFDSYAGVENDLRRRNVVLDLFVFSIFFFCDLIFAKR